VPARPVEIPVVHEFGMIRRGLAALLGTQPNFSIRISKANAGTLLVHRHSECPNLIVSNSPAQCVALLAACRAH
jgi:hypothetical protein